MRFCIEAKETPALQRVCVFNREESERGRRVSVCARVGMCRRAESRVTATAASSSRASFSQRHTSTSPPLAEADVHT